MGEFPSKKHQFTPGPHQLKAARINGAKGGATVTPKKRMAEKVKWLKRKAREGKLESKTVEHMVERLYDPEVNIVDILNYVESIKQECKNPNQKVLVAQTQIQLHKAHFGEKHHMKTENVNINIDANLKEIDEHLGKF